MDVPEPPELSVIQKGEPTCQFCLPRKREDDLEKRENDDDDNDDDDDDGDDDDNDDDFDDDDDDDDDAAHFLLPFLILASYPSFTKKGKKLKENKSSRLTFLGIIGTISPP